MTGRDPHDLLIVKTTLLELSILAAVLVMNDAGRPRWQETILTRQLKPAALRAGIGKIGWHTLPFGVL